MIGKLYQLILQESPSEQGRLFIKNLSISASSGLIASGLFFVVNVLAGRWLGPQEYGRYALIVTYAQLLLIPMMLGLDTATAKYLPESKQKSKLVGSGLAAIMVAMIITGIITVLVGYFIGPRFHLTFFASLITIFFGGILTLKTYADAVARGFQWFGQQGVARVLEASIVLISFVGIVYYTAHRSAMSYIGSVMTGELLFIIIVGLKTQGNLSRPNFSVIKQLLRYGIWAIFGGLAGYLLLNVHRIILDRLIGVESVGVYSAYLAASLTISGQLLSYFINVFFPTAAGLKDRQSITRKLRRFELYFAPVYWMIMIGIISLVIILFGKEYPFNPLFITLFALVAVLHALYSIEMWLANAEGVKGVRSTIMAAVGFGVINTVVGYILIKQLGIIGATVTTIIIFALFFVYLTRLNQKLG